MKLNNIEALVFTACQSQTQDKSIYYIHDENALPVLLSTLIEHARNECAITAHYEQGAHALKEALITLKPALKADCDSNTELILKIKQLWWRIWGSEYSQKMRDQLLDKREALELVENGSAFSFVDKRPLTISPKYQVV